MAYKLLYSLAAVGLVGLIGRSESATTNKICLPPFKEVKKQQMDCVLDKKLLPNEAFLKHMCATYGGDVQNGNCYSYAVDEKATTTNCPDGYSEYYFEHMKYCMKAVNNTVAGDLKDNAPKLCGDVTSDILFPWNKAVNMFAFALTGKDCTSEDTGNFYLWFDYEYKNTSNVEVGTLLSKSAEVKSFKQKVEKEKLETKWLDGSRVFVEDDNPVGSAVVFAKCGMWKVVPKEQVGGVICLALAE